MKARALSARATSRGVGLAAAGLGIALALWVCAGSATWRAPLLDSLGVALIAGVTALGLGVPYALAVERWRVPGRRLLLVLGVVPLVVPPYLATIAWRAIFGPGGRLPRLLGWRPPVGPSVLAESWIYTVPCCGLLLGACFFPLVLFPTWAALRRLPGSSLEAARIARGRWGERRILLRAIWPAAMAGALVVGALALVEFAVPQLLRLKLQSEQVYLAFRNEDVTSVALTQALWASAPLMGLSAACAGAALALPWVAGRPQRGAAPQPRSLGRLGWLASAGCLVALGPGAWLPVLDVFVRLVHRPVPPGAKIPQGLERAQLVLSEAWRIGGEDAKRSVVVGVLSATVALGLALLIVLGLRALSRRRAALGSALVGSGPVGASLGAVALALVVTCPAPLVGVLILVGLSHAGAISLLDSLGCLALGNVVRFAPLACVLVWAASRRLAPGPEEAARLAGRSSLWGVTLPQLAPTLAVAWALVYVLSATEYASAAVLEPPGQQVLALYVVNQAHYGDVSELSGLCTLLLGVVLWPLPPLCALSLLWRRR